MPKNDDKQPGKRTGVGGQLAGVASGPRAIGMIAGADEAAPSGATPPHYDEDMFLVAARYGKNDKRSGGDTELFSFKVQESYKAWARLVIERGKFPFQSISDIGRLGLTLALRWLESIDPNEVTGSVMHQIGQMEEVVAWQMRGLRYIKYIDEVAAMVAELLALPKGRLQVGRVLRRLKRHISAMDRSGLQAFYVAHFEKMFDDRFAALQQAGLILLESNMDEDDDEGSGAIDALLHIPMPEMLRMPGELIDPEDYEHDHGADSDGDLSAEDVRLLREYEALMVAEDDMDSAGEDE